MIVLVAWVRDRGLGPAAAQVRPDHARRIRLVAPDGIRAGAGEADVARHAQMLEHRDQHR